MSPSNKAPPPPPTLELHEDQSGFHVGPKARPKRVVNAPPMETAIDDDLLLHSTAAVERAEVLVNEAVIAGADLTAARLDRILQAAERMLALARLGVAVPKAGMLPL